MAVRTAIPIKPDSAIQNPLLRLGVLGGVLDLWFAGFSVYTQGQQSDGATADRSSHSSWFVRSSNRTG
ncbi:MAG: hypothetical protein LGR52_11580, partial [Candidatus Thiosymbion ectosymbiont of Robbea hypermnestra]|nr:hypothetical protein [Candidatus Thiosymbion ectosymbiont of Robbea hypermnestra]